MGAIIWFLVYFGLSILIIPEYGVFSLGLIPVLSNILTCFWLAYFTSSKRNNPVGAMFWVFVYIFLILAPISQELSGRYPWYDFYSVEDVHYSFLIVFVGILFSSLGFFSFSKNKLKKNIKLSFSLSNRRFKIFKIASLFLAFIGIQFVGGFDRLFYARADAFSDLESISSAMIINSMIRVPLYVVGLILLYKVLSEKNAGLKAWVEMVFYMSLVLIINNPISTPRFWFACVFVSYFFILLSSFKTNISYLIVPIMIFSIIVVFPFSDVYRKSVDVDLAEALKYYDPVYELKESPDFDAFQQIVNTKKTVDQIGHTYGYQLAGSILFWFPRVLWPNKPLSTGEFVADQRGYSFKNLSCPLWAEIFIDFGLLGVAIIFFYYGRFVNYCGRNLNGMSSTFVYFFGAYQIYFLRGTLMAVCGLLIIVIFCFLFLRERNSRKIII